MPATMSDSIAPVRAAVAGRYEIGREIGRGAFATVYLAKDLRHDRPVAIKVLNADPSSENSDLRFLREIRLLARLQHPNILPLIDSGHADAMLYYVMPFVSGESLRGRMDRERQLSLDAAVAIAGETADALGYAHDQGIVHRDIKPENILLSAGHPIIADFGIARAIDVAGVRQLTRTGFGSPGTPAYMSPEQLTGEKEVDRRSDIYSLGCVLFEMLTGTPPFAGKNGLARRLTEPPPVPSTRRQNLPVEFDAVISKALAREPAERYPSAADFNSAVKQISKGGKFPQESAPSRAHADLSNDEEARDSFLIARRIIQRRSRSDLPIAERELANAVKRDPNFAKAHALLGVLWVLRADFDTPLEVARASAIAAAKSALSIDASLSDAHAVLGLCATLAWDWPAAGKCFEMATANGSTSPLSHHWRALYLCSLGQTEAAQQALNEAIALDRGNPTLHAALGLAAFYHGDGTSAMISQERSCALDPTNSLFPILLGMAHTLVGECDAAMSRYMQAVELAGQLDPMILAARVWTLCRRGRKDEALAERASFQALAQRMDVSPFLDAAISASLDEPADAVNALRRAKEQHDGWLLSLRVHPWMDPLRSTSEFKTLVADIGL
jgi:serine/threonine protein kinase/Tfp pilus assembly protein PilF